MLCSNQFACSQLASGKGGPGVRWSGQRGDSVVECMCVAGMEGGGKRGGGWRGMG